MRSSQNFIFSRAASSSSRKRTAFSRGVLLIVALATTPQPSFCWTGVRTYKRQNVVPSSPGVGSRLDPLASLATPPAESRGSSSSSSSASSSSTNPPPHSSQKLGAPQHVGPSSSASSTSSSSIQHELQSGRVLEGGQVIDFSSVKASSRAEQALAEARQQLLQRSKVNGSGGTNGASSTSMSTAVNCDTTSPFAWDYDDDSSRIPILGINQDVIKEVGYQLGTFATPQEIQDCAAYLRSIAPSGLLQPTQDDGAATANSINGEALTTNKSSFTPQQISHFRTILNKAYFEAGEVTGAFAKTFYMGTMLLPPAAREAIWAVYVWCRRTDEIVDAPRDNPDDMLLDLSSWEMRLERLWSHGEVVDVYDLCLLDCRIKYPTMDITPFMDMIRGMLMDVPGLGQDRYDKFDELHLYCYRVAGTVGLMSLPIFGCAPGFDDETAREPALSLGVAFQLTNILRDVGEDAIQRGRVYLPQEDLERFGVTEDQIFEQRVDDKYINLMKFQIARARMYYERARRGVFMLAPESRLPVQSSLDAYGRILDKIEANGYDSLTKRAYVDKWEKLSIIPSSWYRTLDISRVLPLPGDKPVVLDQV